MEPTSLKEKLVNRLRNPAFVLGVYVFFALAATASSYFIGKKFDQYTHYNNFILFRESFHHLINNIDLYKNHEPEHYDYYKYSPAFAVFMAPFAALPDFPGLLLWNLLNALALFFAIRSLPLKNEASKIFMLWFILQELLTTMQNSQSNGLVAALMIFGFNKFEKGNGFFAALFIMLSAYIKIYGLLAAVLFLFYPNKLRFVLYSIMWMVVLAFIPLLFVSVDQLTFLYRSWYTIVAEDAATQYGVSLLGFLHSLFNLDPDKNIVLLSGLALLFLPLHRIHLYKEVNFRLAFMASLLIWLIIFNHRAESSTYVIAIAGIAIWYFNSAKTKLDTLLVITAFIITCWSTTDLFPSYLYYHFVKPYSLKALPCILIWVKLTYDLVISSFTDAQLKTSSVANGN